MAAINDDLEREAGRLADARASGAPAPLPAAPYSLADAYRIQRAFTGRLLAAGTNRIGWKVGATSELAQASLACDHPMFGPLLADTVIAEGGTCATTGLIAPLLEVELALRIGQAPPAADAIAPAFELVDARYAGEGADIRHAVADVGRACRFVVGRWVAIEEVPNPELVEASLSRDGEVVAEGRANAALGNPVNSVAWLADELARRGEQLAAGDIVLSGTFTSPVRVAAGERYRATFPEPLGTISIRFE